MSAHKPECFFREKTLFPGQGHDWKAHGHDIVTLVVHGRLDEVFAGGAQHCGRWELHYKPHGTPHRTHTGPDGVRMFMVGVARASGGFPAAAGGPRFDRPQLCGGGVPVARALRLMLPLAGEGDRYRAIDPRTSQDLAGVFAGGAEPQAAAPSWITEVHEQVQSERDAPTRLEGLAARYRVHAVYLARAFRRHYGVSIGAMRRRIRIDGAVNRLTGSRSPLAELAMDLGYADQSHFTREFKRETGWTPGRFRNATASLGNLPLS